MARVILVALWAAVVLQCVRSQCVGVAGEGCIDCFKNPKTRGCEDTSQWLVQWPESLMKADLAKLCKAMPHMSGCSVEKACKAIRNRPEAQFCTEWSLLSNICSPKQGESMETMMGCTNYTTLCGSTERAGDLAGTRVKGCHTGIPKLPPTKKVLTDVAAACLDSFSQQRVLCTAACQDAKRVAAECSYPLMQLSTVCLAAQKQKTYVAACDSWSRMCNTTTTLKEPFCSEISSASLSLPSHLLTLAMALLASLYHF